MEHATRLAWSQADTLITNTQFSSIYLSHVIESYVDRNHLAT